MKNTWPQSLLFLFVLAACAPSQKEPLTLNSLFSDGMVVQRDTELTIWGTFTPGGTVTVETSWGERATGSPDVNGQWQLQLLTPEAGGPHELTIATADSTIQISNVMAGEVWLASGQSNMEWPLSLAMNAEEEIANSDYPNIRMITVPRTASISPETAFSGEWLAASPETSSSFSAVAYFFARKLQKDLGVPIGIIHSSWGGTVAEAWTSSEKLATLGDFDDQLKTINDPAAIQLMTSWLEKFEGQPNPASAADWEAVNWGASTAATVDLDDSSWDEISLPGRFDEFNSEAVDGLFWLRKTIELGTAPGAVTLSLGAIDDRDMVYVNGQLVGSTMEPGKYQEPRVYEVAEGVFQAGTNVIAILGMDTGGPGEFNGAMTMTDANGTTNSLEGTWKQRFTAEVISGKLYVYNVDEDLSARPAVVRVHANLPTALYNGMISPLIPYTIKGAIWYQGESNVGRAAQYERLFPAMITDWRERWDADFSFYFVQIAPYGYSTLTDLSPALRDAQRRTLSLNKTGMAVTMDIGNPVDIHPTNKQDVGSRLALWALAQDYGKDVVPSGPLFVSAEPQVGAMIVSFDHVAEGLRAADGGLTGFEIADADGEFAPASATISGNQVSVSSPRVSSPTRVRYAWTDTSEATLFNSEGLPASSFTSETTLP